MTPFELFALSHCSKRCTELVPLAGTKDYQYIIDLSNLTIAIRAGNFQQYTFSFNGTLPDAFAISSQNPILELKTYLLKFFDISALNKFAGLRFTCKSIKFPQELRIENSSWFGIGQLCSAVNSSVKIELHGSLLSIEDMSLFLEKWMAGEFPNMTTFLIEIHSHRFNSNDARVLGMQLPIWSLERTVTKRYFDRFYGWVVDGTIIKNVNGVSAVLKFHTDSPNPFHFMVLA
ncbi:hypothetical protein B9Z55_027269 [Caenorhabditis nigoni]|nr:hypothetical protein B9Z55_027269 [Caenorhabditis nigoni]